MATNRFVISKNGKYAIQLTDDSGYTDTFSDIQIVDMGADLSKYKPIGSTIALLEDNGVEGIDPTHVVKDDVGQIKLFYITVAQSDYSEDGDLNTDGSKKDYYYYPDWTKRVTEEEWENRLLNPIRADIRKLRKDLNDAIARIVNLELNAVFQGNVLYNHEVRLARLEHRAVDGYSLSDHEFTWTNVGEEETPIINNYVYLSVGLSTAVETNEFGS